MNRKELIERKEELIEKMDALLNHATTEQRDLLDTENSRFKELETEVRAINAQLNTTTNLYEKKEEKNMTFERREFAKGLAYGEVRATTETHDNVVPTELYDEVVKKIIEMSSVVADIPVVKAQGQLDLLVEKEALKAQILDEVEECVPTDLSKFEKISMKDNRMCEIVTVSKKLLLNTPIVGIDDITETLSKRIARKLEEQIFSAAGGNKQFTSGLLTGEKIPTQVKGTITIIDLQNLITSMPSVLLKGTKLYVDRTTFSKLSTLQDANGHFYLTNNVIADRPAYQILGIPVEITEEVNGNIVLANIGQAMKLKLGEGMNITVLTEKYAPCGQVGVMCTLYGDVALVDKQAVKILAA